MAAPHEEFAGRLHQALDAAKFDGGRARAGALAMKYAVSRETTRKWLLGLALPELPRIIELAQDTGTNLEWLATGRGDMRIDANVVREPAGVYGHVGSRAPGPLLKHIYEMLQRLDDSDLRVISVVVDHLGSGRSITK